MIASALKGSAVLVAIGAAQDAPEINTHSMVTVFVTRCRSMVTRVAYSRCALAGAYGKCRFIGHGRSSTWRIAVKIENIETYLVRLPVDSGASAWKMDLMDHTLIRVDTDSGISGWGEAWGWLIWPR